MIARAVKLAPNPGPRESRKEAAASPTLATPEIDDHKMVADFLRGEPKVVAEVSLWIRQAASRHRGRLPSEWEDLCQDLLLEVTTVLGNGGFRGECKLRTFVWRIAQYRCLNRIRDLARRPESDLGEQILHLPDPARPVLERLEERESVDLLHRFLETVSTDCRQLWRSILAGASYREMSREIGTSEGALRVRVLRCRRKALALWQTWLDSENR